MSLAQKILDLKNKAKDLKDKIDNDSVPAGPLSTSMARMAAKIDADDAKDLAQEVLDDPKYSGFTPVLLTFSDDERADTRAAAIKTWADDAQTHDTNDDKQDAADCLHSVVETVTLVKLSIDNGPGGPS